MEKSSSACHPPRPSLPHALLENQEKGRNPTVGGGSSFFFDEQQGEEEAGGGETRGAGGGGSQGVRCSLLLLYSFSSSFSNRQLFVASPLLCCYSLPVVMPQFSFHPPPPPSDPSRATIRYAHKTLLKRIGIRECNQRKLRTAAVAAAAHRVCAPDIT